MSDEAGRERPLIMVVEDAESNRPTLPSGITGVLPKLTEVDSLLELIRRQCRH